MKIPTFGGQKIVDKEGECTSEFQQYNDQLNIQMQKNLSDDGTVIPSQSTVFITNYSSKMPNGTIWYDSTTEEFKGRINGVVKVFTLT